MKTIPYFNQAFADILKQQRKKAKLTQTRLAFALDSNEGTIRRFEGGKQTPLATTLALIAEALGIEHGAFLQEIMNQVSYLADKNKTEE